METSSSNGKYVTIIPSQLENSVRKDIKHYGFRIETAALKTTINRPLLNAQLREKERLKHIIYSIHTHTHKQAQLFSIIFSTNTTDVSEITIRK